MRPAKLSGFLRLGGRSKGREQGRGAIADAVAALAGIGASTERVFLVVGQELADLQTRASDVSRQSSSMADFLSDDRSSWGLLEKVLAEACELSGESGIEAAIGRIRENGRQIHKSIRAIGAVVKSFDTLGVMTRIESGRFESAGATFAGLADSVAALSARIRRQTATAEDSASALVGTTVEAAGQMRELAQRRRENLGPLANRAGAQLRAIGEYRERVSETARRFGRRFDEISRSVGDVVAALQFQDIVRQQIEHVVEALRAWDPSDEAAAGVAALQAAQIENSRTTFERSVAEVCTALTRIEAAIGQVAAESARLVGVSGSEGESSLAGLSSDLSEIRGLLDSNAAADRRFADAGRSLEARLSEMCEAIDGVRTLGGEMQRTALNATIQAAKLGGEGAALEVIAQAIQELAREIEKASGALGDRLQQLQEAAAELHASITARGAAELRREDLRKGAEAVASMQRRAEDSHTRIAERIAALKRQIRDTIAAFGNGGDCVEALEQAAGLLRQFADESRPAGARPIERIASNYTMQSERAVHETILRRTPESEHGPGQAPAQADEDGVPAPAAADAGAPGDDNVEFF